MRPKSLKPKSINDYFTTEVVAGNGFLKIAFLRQNGMTVERIELLQAVEIKR